MIGMPFPGRVTTIHYPITPDLPLVTTSVSGQAPAAPPILDRRMNPSRLTHAPHQSADPRHDRFRGQRQRLTSTSATLRLPGQQLEPWVVPDERN